VGLDKTTNEEKRVRRKRRLGRKSFSNELKPVTPGETEENDQQREWQGIK
jgi:hypothetical protein